MESESKYASQIKNLRRNYVRFSLDFKPDELEEYKQACARNGTTATTEIKRFVREYCDKNKSK